MKNNKLILIGLLVASLAIAGCKKKEDKTVTGMVISVDGTTIWF